MQAQCVVNHQLLSYFSATLMINKNTWGTKSGKANQKQQLSDYN